MYKCAYLLWETARRPAGENRDRLVDQCAPQMLALGLCGLTIDVDDEYSTVKSPAPKCYKGAPISAVVSVYMDSLKTCKAIEKCLCGAGFTLAGYLVDESVYTDYGDNRHSGPRSWPDGERSPGVLAVTLLTKPRRFTQREWLRRWHGRMSPISEKIQPRQRYVRNVIVRAITENAPAFDGLVEEVWPSAEHISNPRLFYCADNPWTLVKHQGMMLYAILQFHNVFKFRTTTMSEYLIKTVQARGETLVEQD